MVQLQPNPGDSGCGGTFPTCRESRTLKTCGHKIVTRFEPGHSCQQAAITMKSIFFVLILVGFFHSPAHGQWQKQAVGTDADFRGLCVVSSKVVWVSGT